MKRLLLLFILSPVLLFGQMRQKAIVDSIKAAGNDIQRVSGAINSNPGNKVESIQVSDSGEYVTVLMRVHVAQPLLIPSLPLTPVAKIKIRDIVADEMSAITVPPISLFHIDPDIVMALPIAAATKLNTTGAPVVKMDTATVPPISLFHIDPDIVMALPIMAAIRLNTKGTPVVKLDTVTVPPMPKLKPEFDPLPLITVTPLKIEGNAMARVSTTIVPDFPEIEPGGTEPITPSALIPFVIKHRPLQKPDSVVVDDFVDFNMALVGMHLSAEGYDLLEKMEGFSPELYSLKDGGFTIGFGFFVPYGEGSKWRKGVTWEEAERLIRQKVPAYEDQVKKYINVPLTQEEFDALTMLAYNLGGFSKATSIVNDINTNASYEKLQKDWMRFVHSKAPGVMKGLMNRRKDELQVRYEANYQPERKIQILKK